MKPKTTTISVRVTEETKKRLKIIAHYWGGSVTSTIEELIQDYYNELEQDKILLQDIIESMEGKE
jgi:predicted DNA-binding protein